MQKQTLNAAIPSMKGSLASLVGGNPSILASTMRFKLQPRLQKSQLSSSSSVTAALLLLDLWELVVEATVPPTTPSMDELLDSFSGSSSSGMQGQLVCNGCRNLLLYPRGATNVRCAICSTVTPAPLPGMETAQLVCGGCRTLLMYTRGATSVRCSCCHTVNLTRAASSNVAHVSCGQCRTMLMYPYGSQSVKCAICQYVTNIGMGSMSMPIPVQRPNGASMPSTSTSMPHAHGQTVVVENPMSVDESGKLVSNVVVGVTTGKK
ncbi:hypothetical protein NE237_031924 [Protea cynaroides]|uniref:Zinc finger LSD1-type domain-containing protein n=1 Tax=Protea cynaroides TaxID=273540 RepID=A0A9Q0R2Z6_9MAGN|nr:hypothetical protein NE237_031924 [Protea cynaroides]